MPGSGLFWGDCFDILPTIDDRSIDLLFADMPYGVTSNPWDRKLDLNRLWPMLVRILKPHAACLFTASNGFEFELYNSNPSWYRYKWVWNKNTSGSFLHAKNRPLNCTEDILVFSSGKPYYYPQMEERGKVRKKGGFSSSTNYSGVIPTVSYNNLYYPKNLINISGQSRKGKIHPTQKPLELLEYLISTYSQPGETVLDFCMGSGSTGLACRNLERNFVGIENDLDFFLKAAEILDQNV